MAQVPFELSLLGGAVEKRWRRRRPDIEALPWSSLDPGRHPEPLVAHARRFWTQAAFQEHKTAASIAASVQAMVAAGAPVDLVAVASRFLEDECAHVELCARVAMQLGGGARLLYEPTALCPTPRTDLGPLAACAELIVRVFCVGEAVSVPLQRATARAQEHPLLAQVVRRIAKDEAAHGAFGWDFLDWAGDALDDEARTHLRQVAHRAVDAFARMQPSDADAGTLGWLPASAWRAEARRALEEHVIAPLVARELWG